MKHYRTSITKEQDYFDRLAKTSGEIWWGSITPAGIKRLQRRAAVVKQKISGFKEPIVLEIGCGTGAFSKSLLGIMPELNLIGCDISPKSVQIARRRYTHYKNACFEVADVTALPYPSQRFQAVIGNSILHHLPVDIALKECFRVLNPGGIICSFEPNMLNPQIAIEKNIYFVGKWLQNTKDETAFFRWMIAELLRKIGFQDVAVRPFDFLHPITPSALINFMENVGRTFENIPLLKEFSGSLLIFACKPV